MKGRTGSVRQYTLDVKGLRKAEQHGKRLDVMGPSRAVSDVPPLVYGTLDLEEAQRVHMDGVKQQTGTQTKALHMLVQYPTELAGADTEKAQKAMLGHAVRFANRFHGGDAVFAARLDRDEAGRHTVDVFLMPRYDFTYKDGRTQRRAAVSKFAKANALANKETLIDADEDLDPTGSIVQGRAMQAAWYEYLREDCGLRWVEPPERKKTRSKDRLEPEEYKQKQDGLSLQMRQADWEAKKATERKRLLKMDSILEERTKALNEREAALLRDASVVEAARRSAQQLPDPDLSAIAQRGRRQRPQQSHGDE